MLSLSVPGSKSFTNRALIFAALAKGKSTLHGVLDSDDTRFMISALRELGVNIRRVGKDVLVVESSGQLHKPKKPIYCGNAGTVMRFLAATLATQPFEIALDGDRHMRKRPIEDLLRALRQLGVHAESLRKNGCPPILIRGPIKGRRVKVSGKISSQFLSGLLLAAGKTALPPTIEVKGELVSKPYVDMTIEVMRTFGVKVKNQGYKKFTIPRAPRYRARTYFIEGDASSASYFWGISALTGREVEINNVPSESSQADLAARNIIKKYFIYPPLSSSIPRYPLLSLNCRDFPDSAMTLAVLAAFRRGRTRLIGLSNLRVKESDRLHALKTEVTKIGARVKELKDGLEINGNPDNLHAAHIKTYDDHRVAMCFGMAGFVLPKMTFDNPSCVKKTYPNFWRDLKKLKHIYVQKNIILTGMRGTGKSAIGRSLALKLKRKFVDLDSLIAREEGMAISEIVALHGWEYFRELEKKMVRRVVRMKNALISTGGGTLIDPVHEKLLKKNGLVILLEADLPTLKKQLMRDPHRPSLTGSDAVSELAVVYKSRSARYHAVSDEVLDVSSHTKNERSDLRKKVGQLVKIIARRGLLSS